VVWWLPVMKRFLHAFCKIANSSLSVAYVLCTAQGSSGRGGCGSIGWWWRACIVWLSGGLVVISLLAPLLVACKALWHGNVCGCVECPHQVIGKLNRSCDMHLSSKEANLALRNCLLPPLSSWARRGPLKA
jgi:hypothetical protein